MMSSSNAASTAPPPQNPFIDGFFPYGNESAQERAQREREEAEAAAVSDAIDEGIMRDKVGARKSRAAVKVVMLGQSGSGQSLSNVEEHSEST